MVSNMEPVNKKVSIGETIRQFRIRARMTQKDLAARVGLTQQAISLIESGNRRIDVDLFIQILVVFDERLDQYLADNIDGVNIQKLSSYFTEVNSDSSSSLNARFIQAFNNLNANGKKKALEQMDLLAKIGEYKIPQE